MTNDSAEMPGETQVGTRRREGAVIHVTGSSGGAQDGEAHWMSQMALWRLAQRARGTPGQPLPRLCHYSAFALFPV